MQQTRKTGIYAIKINQGADWALTMRKFTKPSKETPNEEATPVDFTGWKGIMQIRKTAKSPVALATLTTENGGIELDSEGFIRLSLTALQTEGMYGGPAYYDLKLTNPIGETFRQLEGTATIFPENTKL